MEAMFIVTVAVVLLFVLGILSVVFGEDSRESVGDDWVRPIGA